METYFLRLSRTFIGSDPEKRVFKVFTSLIPLSSSSFVFSQLQFFRILLASTTSPATFLSRRLTSEEIKVTEIVNY